MTGSQAQRSVDRNRAGHGRTGAAALGWLFALVVVAPLLVYFAVVFGSGTTTGREFLARALSRATGYTLTVESLHVGFDLSVRAAGVEVAAPERPVFLTLAVVESGLDWRALPRLRLLRSRLDAPHVYLDRVPPAAATDAASGLPPVPLVDAEVRGAVLHTGTGFGGDLSAGPLDFELESLRGGNELAIEGTLADVRSGGHVQWSLRLDPRELRVRGHAEGTAALLGPVVVALVGAELPSGIASAKGSAEVEFAGTLREHIAFTLAARAETAGAAAPLALVGEGRLDTLRAAWTLRGAVDFGADTPELAFAAAVAGLGGAAQPDLDVEIDLPETSLVALRDSQPALLPGIETAEGTIAASLDLKGPLDATTTTGTLTATAVSLRAPGWEVGATVTLPVAVSAGRMQLGEGVELADVTLSIGEASLRAEDATLSGEVGRAPAEAATAPRWTGNLALSIPALSARAGELNATGWMTSSLAVELAPEAPLHIDAIADMSSGTLSWGPEGKLDLAEHALHVTAGFTWDGAALAAHKLELAIAGLATASGDAAYRPGTAAASIALAVESADVAALRSALVAGGWTAPFAGWEHLRIGGRLAADVRLDAEPDATAVQLAGLVRIADASVEGEGWTLGGQLEIPVRSAGGTIELGAAGMRGRAMRGRLGELEWTLDDLALTARYTTDAESRWALVAELSGNAAKYRDAAFDRAGEGLAFRLRATGNPRVDTGETTWSLDGSLASGGLLWKRLYLDAGTHPLAIKGTLVRQQGGSLAMNAIEIAAAGLGRVTLDGHVTRDTGAYSLEARLDVPNVERPFAVLIAEPLASSVPLFSSLRMKGSLGGALRARGVWPEAAGVAGALRAAEIDGRLDLGALTVASSDGGVRIGGLEGSLPLRFGKRADGSASEAIGRLAIETLEVAGLTGSDLEMSIRAEPGLLAAAEPIRLGLSGGSVTVSVAAKLDASLVPSAELALALDGVALAPLATALAWPAVEGKLGGRLESLRIEGGRMRSTGTLTAQVFGGRVVVRDPGIDSVFARVPTLRMDVDIEDVELASLTEAFAGGHVSGVLRGQLRDLEIADGQPVAFDGMFETVARKGVPQVVSLNAIRQISILGGSGRDPLASGLLLRFFDEYRYAKMGFRCRLHNDRFTVRGIEELDGQQFLVVGSWVPPRVNVVSHTQEISFSQMVDRLKRVWSVG